MIVTPSFTPRLFLTPMKPRNTFRRGVATIIVQIPWAPYLRAAAKLPTRLATAMSVSPSIATVSNGSVPSDRAVMCVTSALNFGMAKKGALASALPPLSVAVSLTLRSVCVAVGRAVRHVAATAGRPSATLRPSCAGGARQRQRRQGGDQVFSHLMSRSLTRGGIAALSTIWHDTNVLTSGKVAIM